MKENQVPQHEILFQFFFLFFLFIGGVAVVKVIRREYDLSLPDERCKKYLHTNAQRELLLSYHCL